MTPRTFSDYDPLEIKQLGMIGRIPLTAYSFDNRFSSCLYLPDTYQTSASLRLLVLVHSSARDATELRDKFVPFADTQNCALIAPLFPQGIIDPDDRDNYKKLEYNGIRFDLILLGMVEEAKQRWPKLQTLKLLMHGFSGGGQFVHRFTYLHPGRLDAVVIGAPGNITPLNFEADYPKGLRDAESRFGIGVDASSLRRVRALFLVGDLDTSIDHLLARGRLISSGCLNRVEILGLLEVSWRLFGINTEFNFIQGAGHESDKVSTCAQEFFTSVLASKGLE